MAWKIDRTGIKYGKLTAIKEVNTDRRGVYWLCKCDCGKEVIVLGSNLSSGHTQSCGCLHNDKNNLIDLTGKTFGYLTVLKRYGSKRLPSGQTRPLWLCECECGNRCVEYGDHLKRGAVKSCGCIGRSFYKQRCHLLPDRHGGSKDRLYSVWEDMLARCYNQNNNSYDCYGGRGIYVCNEWMSYSNFKEWATNNGYDQNAEKYKCTIDRINVNDNYSPNNCRWVDMKTQDNNKRNNYTITYQGVAKTLAQWSEQLNINEDTLKRRVNKYGSDIIGEILREVDN